jgi:hypothetical protein
MIIKVDTFIHLGSKINSGRRVDRELDRRIQYKFYPIMKGLLWNRVIPEQQSIKYILKRYYIKHQNVDFHKEKLKQDEAKDMKCLRSIEGETRRN